MKKIIKQLLRKVLFKLIGKKKLISILDLNLDQNSSAILNILKKHGYEKSVKKGMPLSDIEEPLPWYTYPAIEYLNQLDLKDKTVFEWGCGNSSLYFSSHVKEIISIEDNQVWFDKINSVKPNNLSLYLISNGDYVNSIRTFGRKFDIIVVDASHRKECSTIAIDFLEPGGFIILDNSDWFRNSAKIIREANLIQVDFNGFGPINNYSWTTSFFFSRDFNIQQNHNSQNSFPMGGLQQILD